MSTKKSTTHKKKTRARPKPRAIAKVEPNTLRLRDLPKLTDKQQAFVDGIATGLSKSDAYRQAYDCTNMQPTSIWTNASQMANHAKVRLWLDWMALEAADEAKCTYDSHLISLKQIRDAAFRDKEYSAAVSAEKVRGQAAGLHDKSVTVKSLDLNKLYEQIAARSRAVTIDIAAEVVDTE